MDLAILKKKIDGFRTSNGQIQNIPPELLFELRQAWENFSGVPEDFRRELGMKVGTLRKLLIDSKKLNHALASSAAMGFPAPEGEPQGGPVEQELNGQSLELIYDNGKKLIRFPSVEILIEFLRKAS